MLFRWLRPVLVTQLAIATLIFQLLHYQTMLPVGLFDGAGYWTAAISFTLFFFLFDDFTRFAVHTPFTGCRRCGRFTNSPQRRDADPADGDANAPEGLIFTAQPLVQVSIAVFGSCSATRSIC